MGILSWFLGAGADLKQVLRKGPVIVDIRSVHEYDQGRIPGSINIPEERLSASLDRIRQFNKPVIFCSTSYGQNSGAIHLMKKNGIRQVYNGGNWEKLLQLKSRS